MPDFLNIILIIYIIFTYITITLSAIYMNKKLNIFHILIVILSPITFPLIVIMTYIIYRKINLNQNEKL